MLKIGILGCWNGFHVREYAAMLSARTDVRIVAVSDDNKQLAQAAAADLNVPAVTYGELLADPAIDGVIVTAAPNRAAVLIAEAVKAGKAVLADKLIAVNGADAAIAAELIRTSGTSFALDLPLAQKPVCLAAQQAVDSAQLGRLTGLRIRNAHGGLVKGVLPSHFVEDASGLLTDIGLHGIYMACQLLGQPEAVTAVAVGAGKTGTPEAAVCILEYKDRALATVEMGYVSPVSPFSLEIYGEAGTFVGGGYASSARVKRVGDEDWADVPLMREADRPLTMLEQWLNDIAGPAEGKARTWNLEQGIVLGRVLEAIRKSLDEGRRISLDS